MKDATAKALSFRTQVNGYGNTTSVFEVYVMSTNDPATSTKTNLLISDNPNATSVNDCIPVQLPLGAVRDALNLVDNPTNLGKKVKLNGSIEKYFGAAGFKSVTQYEWAE